MHNLKGIYWKTGGETIVKKVGVDSNNVLAVISLILEKDASVCAEVQIPISREDAAVLEIDGLEDDEGGLLFVSDDPLTG